MLIDRSHKPWAVFFVVATALLTGSYIFYSITAYKGGGNGPSGSTIPGLIYGFIGFALMIFCGLLGLRKKFRVWKIGKAQAWLRAHIWLGLLSVPLIFFHAGFMFGNNLTMILMILFIVAIVSGIVGVVIQNFLPRHMMDRLPAEATFEQIPAVVTVLRDEADQLIAGACGPLNVPDEAEPGQELPGGGGAATVKSQGAVQGKVIKAKKRGKGPIAGNEPLKSFYLQTVRPFLGVRFLDEVKLATAQTSIALFEHTRTLLPEGLHETLGDLQSICEERRQLALQQRMHFWLHCWLYIHAPISYALLVMSAFHAVNAWMNF